MQSSVSQESSLFEKTVEYFIMFLIIVSTNTVYTLNKFASARVLAFGVGIIMFFVAVQVIALHLNSNRTKLITILFVYYMYIMFYCFMTDFYGKTQFISIFWVFFPASVCYWYARFLDGKLNVSVHRFVNIVQLLSILSLACWVLFSNLHLIEGNTMYSGWSGTNITNYFWIHFDTQTQSIFSGVITRNTGIFLEAPMYAYTLLCALYAELFISDEHRMPVIIILLITLVTTFSTTGIIFGVLAVAYYIIRRHVTHISPVGIVMVTIVAGVSLWVIKSALSSKTGSTSATLRNDDLHAGMIAWMKHPFFGNGFNNMHVIHSSMAAWRLKDGSVGALGFTSGVLKILSDGGIYLFVAYFLPLFSFFSTALTQSKTKEKLVGLILLLATMVITFVPYSPLTMYLISFFYVYYFLDNKQSEQSLRISVKE